MHALRDRLGNPQRPVDAPAWELMVEDYDAWLAEEQVPDEVVAHAPELREQVDAEVTFEGGLAGCHVNCLCATRGKTRDKVEPPELREEVPPLRTKGQC